MTRLERSWACWWGGGGWAGGRRRHGFGQRWRGRRQWLSRLVFRLKLKLKALVDGRLRLLLVALVLMYQVDQDATARLGALHIMILRPGFGALGCDEAGEGDGNATMPFFELSNLEKGGQFRRWTMRAEPSEPSYPCSGDGGYVGKRAIWTRSSSKAAQTDEKLVDCQTTNSRTARFAAFFKEAQPLEAF